MFAVRERHVEELLMPRPNRPHTPFLLLSVPYRHFVPLRAPVEFIRGGTGLKGSAVIWHPGTGELTGDVEIARQRPAGVVLILVLPPASSLTAETDLLHVIGRCRPTAIVPHHEDVDPADMKTLIRRPPVDLPVEFTEYLAWRGLHVDRATRDIIRRTVRLAKDLTTIASLSRTIYLSRRALGRRFVSRGLPVPSHWLQFCRILHAVLRLQNSSQSLHAVACGLGYPDGFALSNQMHRLIGVRPSTARRCLGWEWVIEAWLQKERAAGALAHDLLPVGAMTGSPRSRRFRRDSARSMREAAAWRPASE